MTLKKWMQDRGRGASAYLSGKLKCDRSTIYLFRDGKRIPSRDLMVGLYVATKGAVQPNDFYDLPDIPPEVRP